LAAIIYQLIGLQIKHKCNHQGFLTTLHEVHYELPDLTRVGIDFFVFEEEIFFEMN